MVAAGQVPVDAQFPVFADVLQDVLAQLSHTTPTSSMSRHFPSAFSDLSYSCPFSDYEAASANSKKVSRNFSAWPVRYMGFSAA